MEEEDQVLELTSMIASYEEQLRELEILLEHEPDNQEATVMYQQLQEACSDALGLREDLLNAPKPEPLPKQHIPALGNALSAEGIQNRTVDGSSNKERRQAASATAACTTPPDSARHEAVVSFAPGREEVKVSLMREAAAVSALPEEKVLGVFKNEAVVADAGHSEEIVRMFPDERAVVYAGHAEKLLGLLTDECAVASACRQRESLRSLPLEAAAASCHREMEILAGQAAVGASSFQKEEFQKRVAEEATASNSCRSRRLDSVNGQEMEVPSARMPVLRPPARTNLSNARMHPDNKYYGEEPDYIMLSESYPALKEYMTITPAGRAHYDYTSWAGTRALTAALLHHDFGVKWDLPPGHLVPPLTNRANYVHWLADLLRLSSPRGVAAVKGLDIGCGASLIYCLLCAAIHGWSMIGSDVVAGSTEWAHGLCTANPHLASLLDVRLVQQ